MKKQPGSARLFLHFICDPLFVPLSPLILTTQLDDASFERMDHLRNRFFPAELNQVPAHITLFHHLPGDQFLTVSSNIGTIANRTSPLPIQVTGLRSLGRGVAYVLQSPQLLQVRQQMAQSFSQWLTRQDQQRYQPHLTIQNKVTPEQAKELLHKLQIQFVPFTMTVTGLHLWEYLGGPWRLLRTFEFRNEAA
jgi:2'-5' RNA ligase